MSEVLENKEEVKLKPVTKFWINDGKRDFRVDLFGCSYSIWLKDKELTNNEWKYWIDGDGHEMRKHESKYQNSPIKNITLADAVDAIEMFDLTQEQKELIYSGKATLEEIKY